MKRHIPNQTLGRHIWKTNSTMRPDCIIHFWEGPLTQQKVRKPKCGKPPENKSAALRANDLIQL